MHRFRCEQQNTVGRIRKTSTTGSQAQIVTTAISHANGRTPVGYDTVGFVIPVASKTSN
jgi:hypothetical protein